MVAFVPLPFPVMNILEWMLIMKLRGNDGCIVTYDKSYMNGYKKGVLLRNQHIDLINKTKNPGVPSSNVFNLLSISKSNTRNFEKLATMEERFQTMHKSNSLSLKNNPKSKKYYLFKVYEHGERLIEKVHELLKEPFTDDIFRGKLENLEFEYSNGSSTYPIFEDV